MIETSPATRPGCSTKEAPWPGNCGNQEWWVWLLCNFLIRLIFSIYPTTWWLNHPFEEYMLVNRDLNHFPKVRWQNNNLWNQHLEKRGKGFLSHGFFTFLPEKCTFIFVFALQLCDQNWSIKPDESQTFHRCHWRNRMTDLLPTSAAQQRVWKLIM